MKLDHIFLTSIISLAAAQEPISNLVTRDSCVANCAAIDVCCVSGCQGVLCPTGEQYDNAVHCASQCPLGTRTPRDVVEYTRCRQSCIVDNYLFGTSSSTTSTSSTSSFFTSMSTAPSATSFSNASSTTTSDWDDPSSTSPSTSMNTSTFSTPSSSGYSSSDGGTGTATHTHPTASETSDSATINANLNMDGVLAGVLGAILAWAI